ncbi:WXG100 family type VII secretion target [Nocardiopsis sp. B62]|uniref:WXG100 family type VII secretion target n=1 Tax=Nocardiopsis sp. B62 TaxID=2824874 RepID=UPI001B364379|nr:WXG100 family type VII secretion target [Nocardiopsis sp. B62]MBQ1083451.1 hypothetical protein [Nocardiopsis sp. B62]
MEVSGNSGNIFDIADTERSYKGQIDTVLNQVEAAVVKSLGEWHGAGSDDFATLYDEFKVHKEGVSDAFDDLIRTTETAAENWALTSASVRNRFNV